MRCGVACPGNADLLSASRLERTTHACVAATRRAKPVQNRDWIIARARVIPTASIADAGVDGTVGTADDVSFRYVDNAQSLTLRRDRMKG